jgi:hypothetical protein
MGVYGHLFCKECKEFIFLGKWLRTGHDFGLGFWHGKLCGEHGADSLALGRKALRFIARHMNHQLTAASDTGGLAENLFGEGYLNVDDEYDAFAMLDEFPMESAVPSPARLPGMSAATQWRHPKFKGGDRIVMLPHGGWKDEATGTIMELLEPLKLDDRSIEIEYFVAFDEPQRDSTETTNIAAVLERFLRPLDASIATNPSS